jgi:hypothetical protein
MSEGGVTVLTQEQIKQAIRLEGIFSPQTRDLRDQKLRRDNAPGTKPE